MVRAAAVTETLMEKQRWGAGPHYGAMIPEDRTAVFGLECAQGIEWRNWRPGNEYEKVFVIKNTGTKSTRIKYQLPATKYFSMEFPEPTKIGAGLSWSVKVTFRPVKLEEYDDELTFVLGNGSFSVPLLGRLPKLGIQAAPQEESFGYVAVKEFGERTVSVTNTGDVGVQYKWRLQEPFSIKPSRGHIPQGGTAHFTVKFAPMEASVFSAQAVCMVDDGPSTTLDLHGIGKFPHISVDLPFVNFGELHTGLHMTRHCILSNPSLVPANFEVKNVDSTGPAPVTRVSPTSGSIAPGEQMDLDLLYSPVCTGTTSLDTFEISTPGGNKLKLTMSGTALGPVVTPSSTCVNFGSLEVGAEAVRSVSLSNETDQPARYEFVNDPLGVFTFGDAIRGVIPPLLTVSVTITFNPNAPSHHWKRVTCIVKNGAPFYVDLMGSGFTEKLRPPTLSPHHLEEYLERVAAGGNPLQLEGVGANSPTDRSRAQSRSHSRAQSAAPSEMVREAQNRVATEARSSWEQLFLGYDACNPITCDVDSVEFGACSRLRPADYKSVVLTNNTTGKLTVYPSVPRWQDPLAPPDAPPAEPVFKVFPETADIRPGESTTFRIGFRPPHDGQYYSGVVDFVAHVKHMRSFRTVADHNFNAPFNVPVTVLGNTFLHVPEEMLPKFELSTSTVQFPPTRTGEAVHQTVELMNKGDTTVVFDFQEKSVADVFQVKPRCGRILPHTSVLVALRFCPPAAQQYARPLHIAVNHGLKAAPPLKLLGSGCKPSLHFDVPGGTCFFKPTCVGAGSSRPLILRNPSAIPVVFSWSIPRSLRQVIELSPPAGEIPGKGELTLQATFRPQKIKTYSGQLMCNIIAAQGKAAQNAVHDAMAGIEADPSAFDDCQPLSVVAEGSNGAVSIEPASLDLGVVLAGEQATQKLTLLNHSMGVLRYRMEVIEEGSGKRSPLPKSPKQGPFNPDGNITSNSPDVSVDEPEGILYARTPKTITLLMHPKHRGTHRYQVILHTAAGESGTLPAIGAAAAPPSATADVSISAKFPELQVTDVFSLNTPKLHLWQNLSLQALNTELASAVTDVEIDILRQVANGDELPTKEILRRLDPVEVRFGAGAQGSEPTVVHFELQNTGDVLPIVWSLTSQDGAGVELENWVEHGYPLNKADRELHFIEEHKIFHVVPMKGTLQPGGTCRVTIAYKHIAPGLHELPLLLQIEQGKKVNVKLHGVTVSPETQALSWPLEQHTLLPVPIGETEAPLQVIPLRNGGPSAVKYHMDTTALDAITAENREVEILRLASPAEGVIPPGRTALLNFILQPVEAKEVVVDIPIAFSNGKGTTLSLMGRGFHPEIPMSEQEELEGEALIDLAKWKSFSHEPHLLIPGTLAMLSHDAISMGSMPINAIQRRAVTITNTWDLPVCFTWDLDQMRHTAGCIDGVLEITPSTGELDIGDSAICKIVYKSGLKPQVFQGEVRCWIEPTEDALEANEKIFPQALPGTQSSMLIDEDEGSIQQEEVIAVHPPLEGGVQGRTRPPASQRLPLHVAMTQTVTKQKDALNTMSVKTTQQVQEYMVQMSMPREAPAGHDLLLYLHGRVLADHQLKQASCCVESECEGAKDAHSEICWRVPTVEPLVKEPPSGLFPKPKGGHKDRGQPWQSADPEMGTALNILTDLILEAVGSPELAAAVADLEEEQVPRFAQVSDEAGRLIDEAGKTEPAEPVVQEPPVQMAPRPPPPTSLVIPGDDDEPQHDEPEGEGNVEVVTADEPNSAEDSEAEQHELDADECQGEEPPHVRAMIEKPEVQVFMEFVLESALYGLVQESVVDDWDPLDQQEDDYDEEGEVEVHHGYEGPMRSP